MTRSLSTLCLALAVSATCTFAAPTPATNDIVSSSVSHHAISRRSGGHRNLHGDDLVAWTQSNTAHLRNKYSSKLKSSSKSTKRDSVGSASLINYQHDSTFYTTVDIGTPSQSVSLILDTGSSDIWSVQGRNSWDASSSSTFVNSSTAFSISYGSGDVSGTLATDTFTLADHTSSSQTFAIATAVTQGLLDQNIDGIMGFGFESLSTAKATPFWQASGANQFSFYLQSAGSSSSSDVDGGVFTLGGTNTSLYQGDINWSDVIDESYWLITLGGITIDGTTISTSGLNKVAVDTGTTLIAAPTSVVTEIYSQIDGSSTISGSDGYYQFPCSTNVSATLHFGDQEYLLSGEDFIAGTVDSSGQYCMGAFFSIGSDADDELQYILGDAFLTKVYSIFDNSASTAQVGFASLADGLSSSTTSTTVSKVTTASGAINIRSNVWTAVLVGVVATIAIIA